MDKIVEVKQDELWARANSDRRQPRNDRRRHSDRRDEPANTTATAGRMPLRRMKLVTADSLAVESRKGSHVDARI